MDQATILQILKNHGAPPTPENMQRVIEQSGGGSRGTELLGRSMGLQGGAGEEGLGMDLMLDKVMNATSTPSQQPAINPDSMSDGTAQNGARPGRRVEAAAPVQARPVAHNEAAGAPLQQSGGVGTTRRPGYSNPPTNVNGGDPNLLDGSTTRGYQNETANKEAANRPLGGDDSSGLNWLLAALGLTAGGAAMVRGGIPINNPPQITGPAAPALIEGANPNQKRLPAPTAQLTDESGPKTSSGAPEIPDKGLKKTKGMAQTPEEVARLKAEVDADNAALDTEDLKKKKAPKKTGTEMLMEAAKKYRGLR
jgi:hypothetical protein